MENRNLIERILQKNNSHIQVITTMAIIVTSLIAIAGGYTWYRSNLWRPSVEILSVDFNNATSRLLINGKEKYLYGDVTLAAGANWGVRFGTKGANDMYDTIELVKDNLVYEIYSKSV